jgi:RHS repeat-associated protein
LGGVQTSVYNAVGLLTSRQLGGANPVRVDLGYTDRYQQSSITRYSDIAGTTVVGTSVYSYDDAGHLTSILHKSAAGATLSYYTYTYDSADRVTAQTHWSQVGTVVYSGTNAYSYDSTSQLTSDGAATYSYDVNGNRTMPGYQTGSANRLSTDGTYTYTYDAEGNLTQKVKGAGLETWTYGYDNANRLTSISETSGGSLALSVTYTYDVQGKRVEEDKWKTGVGSTTTRFLFDGQDVIADLNGSNVVQVRYVYGDQPDQILARVVASGTHTGVAWYLTDSLGSVRDIADSSMVVQDHLDFDGFGNVTEASPGWGDRFKFAAGASDSDTGLTQFGARYYASNIGRWDREDPISFRAGDVNLYRYVMNSPTNATDPRGLQSINEMMNQWFDNHIWEPVAGWIGPDKIAGTLNKGSTAGNVTGTTVGAVGGAIIGSPLGPFGSIPAAAIGGFVGGLIGSVWGGKKGDTYVGGAIAGVKGGAVGAVVGGSAVWTFRAGYYVLVGAKNVIICAYRYVVPAASTGRLLPDRGYVCGQIIRTIETQQGLIEEAWAAGDMAEVVRISLAIERLWAELERIITQNPGW